MRIGNLVEIKFRDHAEGESTFVFCVWGRLVRRTRTDLVIAVWDHAAVPRKRMANDPNVCMYTIARDAVISERVLS